MYLISEINLAVTQPHSRANEERSGDVSESDARRFEGTLILYRLNSDNVAVRYLLFT